jgi:hypothetical protein
VYQRDLRFGVELSEHGHWADRVPDIDTDMAALEEELREAAPNGHGGALPTMPPRPVEPGVAYTSPPHFERGAPLTLSLDVLAPGSVVGATLHYRHVDQSTTFRQVSMQWRDGGLVGVIDAEYTATTYPLMHFFDVEHRDGGKALIPGLASDLSSQPYFVLGSTPTQR